MATRKLYDVEIDLETVGQRAGCAIVSVGAVYFDPATDTLGDEFYQVVHLPSCEEVGLFVSQDTMDWWATQSKEAQAVMKLAFNKKKSRPIGDVLSGLSTFLARAGENVRPWSCGADFDLPILVAAYAAIGLPPPWKFWNARCHRTLKSLPGAKRLEPDREGTHHNALDDAKHQARHAMAILNSLKGR